MAIYFVDYENVGSAGIEGVDKLDAGNVVHIFYSMKADTMKIAQVIQLMNVNAGVEFHDVTMRGQKNALDFQLIAMLYFTKQETETCYIISKDTGYDAAISFGKKIGALNVFRKATLLDAYHSERHPAGKRERHQSQAEVTVPSDQDVPAEKKISAGAEGPANAEVLGDAAQAERMAMQAIEQAEAIFETASQDPDLGTEAESGNAQIPEEAGSILNAASQLSILEKSFGGLFDYGLADDMDFDSEDPGFPFPMNEPDQEASGEEVLEAARETVEKEEPEAAAAETAVLTDPAADPAEIMPLSLQMNEEQKSPDEENEQGSEQTETEAGPAEAGTEESHSSSRRRNRRSSSSRSRKRQNGHTDNQAAEGQTEKSLQGSASTETVKSDEEHSAYVRNPAFEARVAQIMSAGGFSLSEEEIALIGEALKTTKNKNQFYQFFRKRKGEAAGREFYLEIRGQYESLKVLKNEA